MLIQIPRQFAVFLALAACLLAGPGAASAASLYVSQRFGPDSAPGNVFEYTASGMKSTFASGVSFPEGLAFNTAGDLFVATDDGLVYEYTPGGTQTTFASGLFAAFGAGGNLYVGEPQNDQIVKITPGGVVSVFASLGSNIPGPGRPMGLAFDSAGNLWATFQIGATGDGGLCEITPGGSVSYVANNLNSPNGLAFNAAGDLFVANAYSAGGGQILEYAPGGGVSTFTTNVNYPYGLAFDASGNLFESDYGSGDIYRFTSSGTQSTFATGLEAPTYLTFTPVPEPSTWLLATLGAGSLWFARRRGGPSGALASDASIRRRPLGRKSLDLFNARPKRKH